VGAETMSDNGPPTQSLPFNTPIESGLRSLVTLTEAFPVRYDLQRLLFFDYLLVHSADAGGPESLHPGTPYRSGEVLVRRGIVKDGLKFLVNRGLVEQKFDDQGITYQATEYATPFLDCLQARYTQRLKERAKWLIATFGHYSDDTLSKFFNVNLDRWGSEFEHEANFRELSE
jgi:hypothetical protein